MTRLIRLPNGNWIHPDTVIAVTALERSEGALGDIYPPRVVVRTKDWGGDELIPCETDEAARELRDGLAAEINGRLDPPPDSSHR